MSTTGIDVQESVPLPGDPERSSITSNAIGLAVANVAARVCVLGLAIALGRGLGVSEYGRYGFAVALATIIVPVADIGITTYVWREVARERSGGDAQAIFLARIKAWLSFAALGLTAGVALLISDPTQAAIIVIVLASTLADGTSAFVYGYFQGREQMGFEARWTALAALLRSLGGIALVVLFGRLLAVLGWMLAVSFVQIMVALRRFLSSVERSPSPGRHPIAWRSVLAMGALSVSVLIYIRADSVIIGVVDGRRAVGLYTAAYALMGATQIVPFQIAQAVTPALSRTFARDRDAFVEHWNAGLRAVLLIGLPLALIATIFSTGLLRLPYGRSFTGGSEALAILVWASPLGVVNSVVAGALYAARQEGWPATVAIVGVVLNVGLNLWAIPQFGITGAAAITIATESAVLLLQIGYVIRRGIAPLPRLPYARIGIALLALALVAVGSRTLGFVAAGALALTAYALAVLASGAVDRRELRLGVLRLRRSQA